MANLIDWLGVSNGTLFPGGWDYCASKVHLHRQPFFR